MPNKVTKIAIPRSKVSLKKLLPTLRHSGRVLLKSALPLRPSLDSLKYAKDALAIANQLKESHALAVVEYQRKAEFTKPLERDFDKRVQIIQKALRSASPEQLVQFQNGLSAYLGSSQKVTKTMDVLSNSKPRPRQISKALASTARVRLSRIETHYTALRVAALRLQVEQANWSGYTSPNTSKTYNALLSKSKSIDQSMRKKYETIYQELHSPILLTQFLDSCEKLTNDCQKEALELARLIGQTLARADGKTDSGFSALSVAAGASKIVSHLQAIHAYCVSCGIRGEAEDADDWYKAEVSAAQKRSLHTEIPVGIPIDLSSLGGQSQPSPTTLVLAEGIVRDLRMVKDPAPPKESTIFWLDNPSGQSMLVRAHMFSLRKNGLQDGAYVVVCGYLRIPKNKRLLKLASNVLDIDRVQLSTTQRNSWEDMLVYRVRKYFLLYKDEMNMFFTPPTQKEE